MKLFTIPIILLSTLLFSVSCSKNKNKSDAYINATDLTEENSQKQDSLNLTSENIINTIASDSIKNPQTPNQNLTITPNPAHGELGHRCDIPVGAPLNSPPANQAATTINTVSPEPKKNVPANSTVTPGKINPPHGEPGHRCDIPVGQPL